MAFVPCTKVPELGNKYYNCKTPPKGEEAGYSTCCLGNAREYDPNGKGYSDRKGTYRLTALPNCVGWACGRFNEIYGEGGKYWQLNCNAGKFVEKAEEKYGIKASATPTPGAIACWKESGEPGHVVVVESVDPDGNGWSGSESGFSYKNKLVEFRHYVKQSGKGYKWKPDSGWWHENYVFQGFIPHPSYVIQTSKATPYAGPGGAATEEQSNTIKYKTTTETINVQVNKVITADYDTNKTKNTSLLSYPTNVESPFIILKIGEYTFGDYSSSKIGNTIIINYPNFIRSMEVTKINGAVNTYKLDLVYQLTPGCDPNFLDKVLSSIGYGKIYISYGDWNCPTMMFKEEEAIITGVTSNVDFAASKITYSISCTSAAIGLYANAQSFLARTAKPSDVIKEIVKGNYGITDVFPGMANTSKLDSWIASNDKIVDIQAKANIDPLSYINYLVTCMIANTNTDNSTLLDSSYYLTMYDDSYGISNGPYFTVTQMKSNTKTLKNTNVYDLDIGYPSDNQLTNFTLNNDNSWALVYKYTDDINNTPYTYSIDNNGNAIQTYSPSYSTSTTNYLTTASQRNWWTKMTQFPITATATIKGLVRPAMLMQYIRVNALFYGQRHIASGLYFVTKQVDRVDRAGYRTTLTLTRFAGDNDYIDTVTEKMTVTKYVLDEQVRKETDKTAEIVEDNTGAKDYTKLTYPEMVVNGSAITISKDTLESITPATTNKVYYAIEGATTYLQKITNSSEYKKSGTLKKTTYIVGTYNASKEYTAIDKKNWLGNQLFVKTTDVIAVSDAWKYVQKNGTTR